MLWSLGIHAMQLPTGGRRMIDRKVEKIKRKLRKLHWYQKIQLMDWLNAWYSDVKEQQRLEEEE